MSIIHLFKKKNRNNLWDLKSFVIGRYYFGESLDVFMEQPVWRGKKINNKNHRFSHVTFAFVWLSMINVIYTFHIYLKKPEFFNTFYTPAPNSPIHNQKSFCS